MRLRDGAWRSGREATIGREGADMDAHEPALTTNGQGRIGIVRGRPQPEWPNANFV